MGVPPTAADAPACSCVSEAALALATKASYVAVNGLDVLECKRKQPVDGLNALECEENEPLAES